MSSAYLRLLIFLPEISIPACASSSPTFCMMYSAYKLNKQGDNIVWKYSFPNLEPVCYSMSSSNCCFLTWIEVSQEVGKVVWYSHLFRNFPQFLVIHTVKGFPDSSVGKESACNAGEPGSIPGSERSPGEENGNPKSHGQRSLVSYSPWGRKESDTTERLHFHFHINTSYIYN